MSVYAITCGGPDLGARIRAVLGAGARVVVRELELREEFLISGVILHARMPGAEEEARRRGLGLHLPGGADVAAVRRRFSGLLGYSAHTPGEGAGADYSFLSPIWPPTSKPGRPALGPEVVRGHVALGGLTPERARVAMTHGAVGVASMGGIFGAPGEEAARVAAFRSAVEDQAPSAPRRN